VDDITGEGEDKTLEIDEETLQDLDLTEDSEAEHIAGGRPGPTDTIMCPQPENPLPTVRAPTPRPTPTPSSAPRMQRPPAEGGPVVP
jgi:hypothetical protein